MLETNSFFTMRTTPEERAMIREVARRLQRSQSSAIKMLVSSALQVMQEQDRQNQDPKGNVHHETKT